ncbi:MAG: hypothetical protein HeimC2_21130 [Candidatus Heimdallarchaeota archaeon LC_2]|nr:MAG: hypothetical protein HeimC2_21130 [Candidatus Heimdallarchaeota archaeon LC_2]
MSPENLRKLGEKPISVPLVPDDQGFIGRECSKESCKRYFKIKVIQKFDETNDNLVCAYCGYKGKSNSFFSEDQIKYAKSIVQKMAYEAISKDLSNMYRPNDLIKLYISSPPPTINYYQEKQLETHIICSNCSNQYIVYGKFAFCPFCNSHNSYDILLNNLQLTIDMMSTIDSITSNKALLDRRLEDALGNIVATFDGFGRELTKFKGKEVIFQNLTSAKKKILKRYKFDFTDVISQTDWKFMVVMFQKRHLIEHKLGVIDAKYIGLTNGNQQDLGKNIKISQTEIYQLIELIRQISLRLKDGIKF